MQARIFFNHWDSVDNVNTDATVHGSLTDPLPYPPDYLPNALDPKLRDVKHLRGLSWLPVFSFYVVSWPALDLFPSKGGTENSALYSRCVCYMQHMTRLPRSTELDTLS